MAPAPRKLKRLLIAPFIWLAAAIFLVEEFIWDWTAAVMARIGAIRLVHAIEQRIGALPPRWAFVAFMLPSTILVPAKLVGLHAMGRGHWLLGSAIFLFAKVAGMALFSRIFNLTRPALMTLPWFARFYEWVMGYRNRIHAYLEHWDTYQRVKRSITSMIKAVKSWFRDPETAERAGQRD